MFFLSGQTGRRRLFFGQLTAPPLPLLLFRWSADGQAEAVPGAASRVIPGMPVNLSQEQIQETLVLQMRLQQVSRYDDDQKLCCF